MPQTKKEGLFFTTIVCFLMVLTMSTYNLIVHEQFTVSRLFSGLLPGFIVAFIVDVVIVATIAKKVAFSLPINKEKKWQVIISVSTCMVLGMVSFMSFYGVMMQGGVTKEFFSNYGQAFVTNLVMALPLQLILVGPFCRMILKQTRQYNLLRETAD